MQASRSQATPAGSVGAHGAPSPGDDLPDEAAALSAWLPGRSWLGGADVGTLSQLGAYRFDDPVGAVGIETLLVWAGTDAPVLLATVRPA
jgi:maltokinase-like protein